MWHYKHGSLKRELNFRSLPKIAKNLTQNLCMKIMWNILHRELQGDVEESDQQCRSFAPSVEEQWSPAFWTATAPSQGHAQLFHEAT